MISITTLSVKAASRPARFADEQMKTLMKRATKLND